MSTTTKLSPAALVSSLEQEPLIGMTAASRLLGILPVNFKRDARPHLTEVPVQGSASVYFRSEVEQLKAERESRRHRSNGNGANAVHQPGPDVEKIRSSSQAKANVAPIPKAKK